MGQFLRDGGLQLLEKNALSWGSVRRSAYIFAEITIRKSQFDTLTPQELSSVREIAEQKRKSKLEDAKTAVLEEMRDKLSAIGLTLKDVLPNQRPRKSKSTIRVKYRSPDGETWSGRGHAPLWLRQLELQGHKREEYAVTEE
jgi:DNA-binding protein H-NS